MKNKKILILGIAKSGTTTLYFKIKNSMPANTTCLFERDYYHSPQSLKNKAGLVKLIFPIRPLNNNLYRHFNKKILIVRDPRDRLISDLLYMVYTDGFFEKSQIVKQYIELLKQKEQNPQSVSVVDMQRFYEKFIDKNQIFKKQKTKQPDRLQAIIKLYKAYKDFFVIKYEDVIDNNIKTLEDFLGFSLSSKTVMSPEELRVARTKNYGDWQNWFTQEDIEYYKPRFKNFMDAFGYKDYWDIPDKQVILSKYASDYVLRLVNERYKRLGYKEISITHKKTHKEICDLHYLNNKFSPSLADWMKRRSEHFVYKPLFTIVININHKNKRFILDTIGSIISQTYSNWEIMLILQTNLPHDTLKNVKERIGQRKMTVVYGNKFNKIIFKSKSDFFGFLNAGDILRDYALFEITKYLNINNKSDLIYTDEEILLNNTKSDYFFKPGWSPDLLLSTNYIGEFFILRKKIFSSIGGLRYGLSQESLYDLLLRIAKKAKEVKRIPLILYTKKYRRKNNPNLIKKILNNVFKAQAKVVFEDNNEIWHIKSKIKNFPKISIIIPTAYRNADTNIKACLSSILRKSTYPNYEIIIVDNSRGRLKTSEIKKIIPPDKTLKIINYAEEFNFSKMNNLAAKQTEGEYLVLLNDDTEIITRDWMERMLEQAQKEKVGVVGTKLLYPNLSTQHGGMFLVDYGGGARHLFRHAKDNSQGYQHFLKVARNCSAVTFACAMIPKKIFLEVDGLDENLNIECNDTDFCLRATKRGYRVIWTPFVKLYHKEPGVGRQVDVKENTKYFWQRWRGLLEQGDPYYNPNLTLDSDNLNVNINPVLVEHREPSIIKNTIIKHNNIIPNPLDPKEIKKILLVKLDHIGDMVLALPAIKMLRTRFPNARITMLCSSWCEDIIKKIIEIDEIITFGFFNKKSEKGRDKKAHRKLKNLKKCLKDKNFDLAIDLRRHRETREILKLSSARYTAGYETDGNDSWLSLCLELTDEIRDMAGKAEKPHISSQICELIKAIPVDDKNIPSDNIKFPSVKFDIEKEKDIFSMYKDLFKSNLIIGIHPSCGSSIRQWPIEHFTRLSDLLIEKTNANIILFGDKEDKPEIKRLISMIKNKHKVTSLAGKISLDEFMTLVKKCGLFIGNCSGPCHIASFLDVPTLMIFAGTVSAHEFSPIGDKTMIIRSATPCSPCYKAFVHQCTYNLKCLKFLWPEKVLEAVYQLLAVSGKG